MSEHTAETLLTLYDPADGEAAFRLHAVRLTEPGRRMSQSEAHLAAWDLLGAALLRDYGIRGVRAARSGQEKPVLLHGGLRMNLSHCRGLAVCVTGRSEAGTDAEPPRKVKERYLQRILTEAERAWLETQANREFAFSRFWTLKEAYGKYSGAGIRIPLGETAFSFTEDGRILLHHTDAQKLQFFQLLCGEEYVISLCVPAGSYRAESAEGWKLAESVRL